MLQLVIGGVAVQPTHNRGEDARRTRSNGSTPRSVALSLGDEAPRIFDLDPDVEYVIGRDPNDADFVIEDGDVSRAHGRLWFDVAEGTWCYRDLNSTNGSFHSAARLRIERELLLSDEDVLFLGGGRAVLRFRAQSGPRDETDSVQSAAARVLRDEVNAITHTPESVLIFGPSGAGKTTLAVRIHELSKKNAQETLVSGDFVSINCGALSSDPTLLRSELFGHKRGAFTGATTDRVGKITAAKNGTLFLDEIESLSPAAAAFLLDVLDGHANALPLGEDESRRAAVPRFRLVCTTKQPLSELSLRKDLFNRLVNGHIVTVPSLKERADDIPGLTNHFVAELARARGVKCSVGPEVIALLRSYTWPGELRELEGVCRMTFRRAIAEAPGAKTLTLSAELVRRELEKRQLVYGVKRAEPEVQPPPAATRAPLTREAIEAALSKNDGKIQRAAEELGVARNTLKARMEEFGIPRARDK
jgi:DNA-binding NtrC family response regulator